MDYIQEIEQKGKLAKLAAKKLAIASTSMKNNALFAMADALVARQAEIIQANREDMTAAQTNGLGKTLLDRLLLTPQRIEDMAEGLRQIAGLPDPIGEGLASWRQPNGLQISKIRVPLGVVGIIYEARPNVTVDAAGLCLKAGNAVILRGGSEAIRSNIAIAKVLIETAVQAGLPEAAIQLIETTDRQAVQVILKANQFIDVIIPRGGAGLIKTVVENATVPVIETGTGNCHVFVDADADLCKAHNIVINAKCQRPGVCNAIETLLVHEQVAEEFIPPMLQALTDAGVELRGCPATQALFAGCVLATEADWATEYLDLILAIKIVRDIDEAITHITTYSSGHSEAIVTENYSRARKFLAEVDAAVVYVNASTRFTDGFEFGFGAEIGISTQKLHARGPMGLEELTSVKYVVLGDGHIR
jgi:glutamate-5-semialdehyde dehydrogenase